MTGNLEMLINMHKAKERKDANIQAAEDVGKKAELGFFDVEFTMYGCAYLDRKTGKMNYRVSSKADDIYYFIETASREKIFPSKVETMTLKYPVPMGTRELIAQTVKKELAKELKEKYCKDFFEEVYQIADEIQNNQAKELLWAEAEQLEGRFEEEKLRHFEGLVHYSYSCRKLEDEEYRQLLVWIKEEKKSMDEDFVSKDIFEKTIYGIAYIEEGRIKYINNAQREYIFAKAYAMEQNGIFTTPIHEKAYWYNYNYRLADVIKDYKEDLKQIYNIEYIGKLQKIKGKIEDGKRKVYGSKLRAISEKYEEDAAATMRRYVHRWGIF